MNCSSRHSPNDPDARFCAECGQVLHDSVMETETGSESNYQGQKITRPKGLRQPLVVGLALFCSALMAALAFLVYERTRAVVYVNGEKISHAAWQSEVALGKLQVESRYGPKVFRGPEGQENYKSFRYQVLQSLIIDRLIQQEARRSGLAVTPEEAQLRLVSMVGKEGPDLKEFLKQHGLSQDQVLRILQRELLQEKLIGSQLSLQERTYGDPSLYQQASQIYLTNLWSRAEIRFVDKELQNSSQKNSGSCGCCSPGSGSSANMSGCGTKSPQPLDPKIEQEAREAALKAYREKSGPAMVTATVTNYGCHVQMDIMEKGKILKSYSYREGQAWEIN